MTSREDMLTIASLEDREKFYRSKALKLEQSIIFAKEKVVALKKELAEKMEQAKASEQKYRDLERRVADLSKSDAALKQQEQDRQNKLDAAEQLIEELKKNQRSPSDMSVDTYRRRVQAYERLLSDMQREINDKNKHIEIYEKRLAILERRLKAGQKIKKSTEKQTAAGVQVNYRATAYANYAWIINGRSGLIQGDMIIENTGTSPLEMPVLCFRFHPGDAAALKGRVVHEEEVNEETGQEQAGWMILDADEEAHPSGEIWVKPLQFTAIDPGKSLTFSDFQIPIDHRYLQSVRIECFVFFDHAYKIKCGNEMVVNASFQSKDDHARPSGTPA